MSNELVIEKFLEGKEGKTATRYIQNGCFAYKGNTLTTNGTELINYKKIIAYKKDNKLFLNKTKYSVTTSKIQNQLHRLAKNFYDDNSIVEYYE